MKTPISQPEAYDLLVLGSGAAGKLIAWTLAKTGMKTAVIERRYVGGACPNIACLPSKNLIHSAKVAAYFQRSEEFGITKQNWAINMPAVRERKRKMVAGLVDMHLDLYKKSGAELVMGVGRFVEPKTIEVTTAESPKRLVRGEHVVINTGTRPTIDATPGLAEAEPLTHIEALELDRVPEHLLVLGGGYVGLELSQAMRRFGSRVTIIERNPRLVHREDPDISEAMHELFKDEGIEVLTGAHVTRIEGKSGRSLKLRADRNGSEIVVEGTDLLAATGRTPNTDCLRLDLAGVETSDGGYVKVNELLETTAPQVWAAGDCAGSPHFTHISENDFRIVHDNILGGHRVTTGRQVPFCMFTDPEFARVGLNETQAKARGVTYRLTKIPMIAVLRTRTLSETRGFMKALLDTDGDRILGFAVFGVQAGEIMALALVMVVVFIFLQGWRAALIPLLAVPVSLIGTFAIFPLLGFSVNTLSLFGLVLAIGLVVDDAIVVVEAVEHHIEEGMSPKEATLKAMEEVSGPVVAIAIILSAVFLPTVFIPGITGRLYQQFAVTIAISVLISAFNALTLSPALSALLLRPKDSTKIKGPLGRFFNGFNRAYARLTDGYVGVCRALIHKSAFSLLFLALVAFAAGWLGKKLPSGFLPEEDQGFLYVSIQLPFAASMDRTVAVCMQAEDILLATPGVKSCTTVAGFSLLSFSRNTYSATIWVTLKDWDKRTQPEERYDAIKTHLSQKLSRLPGAIAFPFPPPAINGVGTAGGFTFVLEDRAGKDIPFLAANVTRFMEAARKRPEIATLSTTFLPIVPQLYVNVDRDKVLKEGVELTDVYKTLQTFMGGFFIDYFNRFGRQWQVYVQAEGDYRTRAENLGLFYVRNHDGEAVPLASLTSTKSISGPEFTMRYNLYRSAQINGSAAPGYSSAQANKALEEVFAETMPPEMGYDYLGMSFQERKAQQGVPPAAIFGLSFLFVFLILAALYESWSLPFSVLLGTPIAVFGAFAALWSRQMVNNVFAQIGLVMLIGLAAKNAILIVEFARLEYEKGKPLIDAALTGARTRLRPILMTSFAFVLGTVPLALASGAGAVSRRILGTVVIGGMLAATCVAVCLIPVTFYVVEKLARSRRQLQPAPTVTPSGSAPIEGTV